MRCQNIPTERIRFRCRRERSRGAACERRGQRGCTARFRVFRRIARLGRRFLRRDSDWNSWIVLVFLKISTNPLFPQKPIIPPKTNIQPTPANYIPYRSRARIQRSNDRKSLWRQSCVPSANFLATTKTRLSRYKRGLCRYAPFPPPRF